MNSNVYHVHFLGHQLPESEDQLRAFFDKYVEDLAGPERDEITQVVQKSNVEDSYRLTVAVPQRLQEVVERIARSGLEPEFEEPEKPHVEGNSCIVPGTFQLRKFGVTLHPRSISNNPERQQMIAQVLADSVPDFPEEGKDFLNWNYIESDEETGIAVIHWGEDSEEDDGELVPLY